MRDTHAHCRHVVTKFPLRTCHLARIDLGKHKYGGPFTVDEVEYVKAFFRLVKLLVSLVGVFIALISIETDVWSAHRLYSARERDWKRDWKLDHVSNIVVCNSST